MATAAEEPLLSVNQLAEALGVTPRTIRFYEAKGLIAPRRVGATRVLDRRDRALMEMILRGKRLGFSLAEVAEYLTFYSADRTQASQLRLLLQRVRRRLAELAAQRHDLDLMLDELRTIERQAQDALDALAEQPDAAIRCQGAHGSKSCPRPNEEGRIP